MLLTSSVCFRSVSDLETAFLFLASYRVEKIEAYFETVPQLTFNHFGNAAPVDLAFFLNDNGVPCTWITKGR